MSRTSQLPDEAVDVVRARRFELVDDRGKVIATLGVEEWSEGGAVLELRNARGEKLVTIHADTDAGSVGVARSTDVDSAWASLDAYSGLYEAPALAEPIHGRSEKVPS